MPRFLQKTSLAAQLIGLTALCLILMSVGALLALAIGAVKVFHGGTRMPVSLLVEVMAALGLMAILSLCLVAIAARQALQPLRQLRTAITQVIQGDLKTDDSQRMPSRELQELKETFDHMVGQLRDARAAGEESQRRLAERTRTVDQLLEFSQTIQGAGQAEQVYSALAHSLYREIGLAGVVIVTHEPDTVPAITLRAALPEGVLAGPRPIAEMDPALCPCLRQGLAKHFQKDNSPIRCAIDQSLTLDAGHDAWCVPFHIGRNLRGTMHMALPPGETWTEERRQLAQTYANTACSSLIALHLLAEAERQSLTDSLTGLYNRHSMDSLLQREVALAERHAHPLSLVMIDLDHFKQINDAHGHAAGDHLLKAFADCVRMTLRKTDLAFRYGGDEFVIVLPQTPLAQAEQVVQKVRQAFAAADFTHAIAHLDHQPTLSIGLAERNKSHGIITLQNLLVAADQALYEAKNSTRNCVRVYQPPKAA